MIVREINKDKVFQYLQDYGEEAKTAIVLNLAVRTQPKCDVLGHLDVNYIFKNVNDPNFIFLEIKEEQ